MDVPKTAAVCSLFLGSAAGQQDSLADERVWQGAQAFRQADCPAASRLFDEARRLDPLHPQATVYLGYALMSQYIPGGKARKIRSSPNAP